MLSINALQNQGQNAIMSFPFAVTKGGCGGVCVPSALERTDIPNKEFGLLFNDRKYLGGQNRQAKAQPRKTPTLNFWQELNQRDEKRHLTSTDYYIAEKIREKARCNPDNWIIAFNSYIEKQENEAKVEVERTIEEIRRISAIDIKKSREMVREAIVRFPSSTKLKKMFEILSPPKTKTHPASGLSKRKEFEWIKSNRWAYSGQWVALYEGTCVSSGKNYSQVSSEAKLKTDLKKIIITYLP